MSLISVVGKIGGNPASQYKVLSVEVESDRGCSDGSIFLRLEYFEDHLRVNNHKLLKVQGMVRNPRNFKIGDCSFLKLEDVWFYKSHGDPFDTHEVVEGQDFLERYGSGEFFLHHSHRS